MSDFLDSGDGLQADPYDVVLEMRDLLAQFPHVDWRQFSGSFLAELFLGLRFNRKVRRLIDRTFSGACTRPIWVGSRGAGKSMTDGVLVWLMWLFADYDVVNVGGSELQAQNVYAYFQSFLAQFKETLALWGVPDFVPGLVITKETMGRTVRNVPATPTLRDDDGDVLPPEAFVGAPLAKDTRAFVAVLAASQKQVRGPHAGSAKRGGMLIIDEEAEVPGDITHAARYMVNTAVPSVIVRNSTNHNSVGTFAEDVSDPDAKGLELTKTSIFDCCHTCPFAVTTEEQWQAIEDGAMRAPGDEHRTVIHLPVAQPDCSDCPRPQHFRDGISRYDSNAGGMKEVLAPLCGGAAAFAEHGHIPFEGPGGVLQQFDERPNDEDFAVELCASAPSSSGLVIKNREALNRAVVPDEDCLWRDVTQGGGEGVITIDWGLAGQCAVILMQNVFVTGRPAGRRVIIEALDLGKQSDSAVYDQCDVWRSQYGVCEVWADSSHPYCNYNLSLRGFHVMAIKFAVDKALGAGSINGHIEHDALWIPQAAKGLVHKQLAGWRKSDTGQIVKGNDHFCDSLLCGCLKWKELVVGTPTGAVGQRREAGGVNREAQNTIPTVRGGEVRGGAGVGANGRGVASWSPSGRQMGTDGHVGPRGRAVGKASPVTGAAQQRPAPSFSNPHQPAQAKRVETVTEKLMREAREAADRSGRQ